MASPRPPGPGSAAAEAARPATTTTTTITTTTTTANTTTGTKPKEKRPPIQETLVTDDWVLVDLKEDGAIECDPLKDDPREEYPSKDDPLKAEPLEDGLVFLESHFKSHDLRLEDLVLEDDPDLAIHPPDEAQKEVEEEEEEVEEEEEEEEEDEEDTHFFPDYSIGRGHRKKGNALEEGKRHHTNPKETKKKKQTATIIREMTVTSNFNPRLLKKHPISQLPDSLTHHPFCRRPRSATPPDKHRRRRKRKERSEDKPENCPYCRHMRDRVSVSRNNGRFVYHLPSVKDARLA